MTLNALQTACNQSSSRDPVVDYDQPLLTETLRSLKERGLVRVVWADRGPRTLKYHQLLDERLALQPDERALITVLLLRGPQAPGELRTRTDRLHPFADREAVEAVLRRLAGAARPPWCTSWNDGRASRTGVGCTSSGRSSPSRRRPPLRQPWTARSCWPRERALATRRCGRRTTRWRRRTPSGSATSWTASPSTAGCWTGWRSSRTGSPWWTSAPDPATSRRTSPPPGRRPPASTCRRRWSTRRARRFPHLTFSVGDLNGLLRPPAAAGWGAVTAWYALVHLAGSELAPTVASLARVLVPGGWLALALHAGAAVHHAEELMDQPVDVDFVLHDPDAVVAAVRAAGLVDVEWYLRGSARRRGRDRAALRAGAAPGLTPQSRRCISSARSTSRKPRRSLTAFIGALTPATTVKT